MSIRNRLSDAQLLWQKGHREGALLSVLIALAATSRKKFPHPQYRDGEAFKRFVSEEMLNLTGKVNWIPSLIWTVSYQEQEMPFEQFLYTYLRCQLAHVAKVPPDIEFAVPPIPVPIFEQGSKLVIHPRVIVALSEIVVEAEVNDDEFPDPSPDYTEFEI